MGLLDFIKSIFGAGDPEKERAGILEIADSVERYADRYRVNGNDELAGCAEEYSAKIRAVNNVNAAKQLKKEFLALIRVNDQELDDDDDEVDDDYDSDDDDNDNDDNEKFSDNS
jgi:phage host-nuclease inhibitor protein Gam